MSVSDAELATLAATHDIINLGMLADGERRRRHGTRTTLVRGATAAAEPGAPLQLPSAAGELRIEGTPPTRAAAIERVQEAARVARQGPVSAFSLSDLWPRSARAK